MKVKIVGVLGDPKVTEAQEKLEAAGWKFVPGLKADAEQAHRSARELAGRQVRVPFFFVGEPPAEGRPWPRERCGGRAWFLKYVKEQRGLPKAPTKRSKKPASLVDQVTAHVTDTASLDRVLAISAKIGEAVEKGTASFIEADNVPDLPRFARDMYLALQIEVARRLSLQADFTEQVREHSAKTRKLERDHDVALRVAAAKVEEMQAYCQDVTTRWADLCSALKHAHVVARRIEDRLEATAYLMASDRSPRGMAHAGNEVASAWKWAMGLVRNLGNEVQGGVREDAGDEAAPLPKGAGEGQ